MFFLHFFWREALFAYPFLLLTFLNHAFLPTLSCAITSKCHFIHSSPSSPFSLRVHSFTIPIFSTTLSLFFLRAFTPEGYSALPEIPKSLFTLPSLAGDPNVLEKAFARYLHIGGVWKLPNCAANKKFDIF